MGAFDDLRDAAAGLSDRQRHILGELARGRRVEWIAQELEISRVYAYTEIRAARETIGAPTTTGAVVASIMAGAVDMPGPDDLDIE
jgi:DNA-binding CsgD family transcriptional regulator